MFPDSRLPLILSVNADVASLRPRATPASKVALARQDLAPSNSHCQSGCGEIARVFISYARADMTFVVRLVDALEARGCEVVIDRRNPPMVEAWQGELVDFIRSVDTVVFVVSPRAIASALVRLGG
jgi:hypothetical protein